MKTAQTIEAQGERKTARDNESQPDFSPELSQPVKQKGKRGDASRIARWQFKPGQWGNPGGVPKRDVSKEIAQAVFLNNPEMIYTAYCKMMRRGNAYCFQVLAERAWGKLKEKLEIDVGPYHHMTDDELKARLAELQAKLGLVPALPPISEDSKPN